MHDLAEAAVAAMEITVEATAVEPLPTMTYDVVRHRGHWKVLHVGRHSASHPSQKSAIDSAVKLAMESKAAGRNVVTTSLASLILAQLRSDGDGGRHRDLTPRIQAALGRNVTLPDLFKLKGKEDFHDRRNDPPSVGQGVSGPRSTRDKP